MSLRNECPKCGSTDADILAEHPERHGMSLDLKCRRCGKERQGPA